jgi:glycosyltransferase involved in cell wall biosynthesis
MVARLDPMKDHQTFLRAARLFADTNHNARFVCVGDGPKHYRDELTSLAGELGLGNAMIWAGERSDLSAIYSALDLATLTSIAEGFPNVIAEAMACGAPVVATDAGDSGDIIGDSRWVVPPGDPAALKAAWEARLASADGRSPEGLRRRIVEKYSLDSLVDRMNGLLERLAAGA